MANHRYSADAIRGVFDSLGSWSNRGKFPCFGSLDSFAMDRDWKVLHTATNVVSLEHVVRGSLNPISILGAVDTGSMRWLEHFAWLLNIFLIAAYFHCSREMRASPFR
jgi:hypothetical protein